jgi:hypothetical protein
MSLGTLGLALLAGVLTVLSPCVLPLLPIVFGTAQSEHRLGPIGLLSREAMMRWRGRMIEAGKGGKMLLGVLLVAIGLIVATGVDKRLETILVDASPEWLTQLTTRY